MSQIEKIGSTIVYLLAIAFLILPFKSLAQDDSYNSPSFEEAQRRVEKFFSQYPDTDEYFLWNYDDMNDFWIYTREQMENGKGPTLFKRTSSVGYEGVGFVKRQYLCCFYNNLPRKIYAHAPIAEGKQRTVKQLRKNMMPLVISNTIYREVARTNRLANNLYAQIKKMPFMRNPIVAYGLKNLKYKVIYDKGNGKKSSSPTHFDRTTQTLYINEEDIKEYGFVVLLHEALHAALYNAKKNKIISERAYTKIASMNKRHFSNYTGYVGVVGSTNSDGLRKYGVVIDANLYSSGMLGPEKAFTIGYTYALIYQFRNELSRAERVFADKFLKDVEDNKKIADVTIDLPTFGSGTFDLRLITDNDNKEQKTARFTRMFLNPSSLPRREIQVLYNAIRNERY